MMLYRYIVLSLSLMIARKFHWKPCLFTFVILWLARWPIRDSLQPIVKLATLKVQGELCCLIFCKLVYPCGMNYVKLNVKKNWSNCLFRNCLQYNPGLYEEQRSAHHRSCVQLASDRPCPRRVSGECCWFGAAALCLVHLCWVTCVCTGTWTVLKASYQSWKVQGLSRAQTRTCLFSTCMLRKAILPKLNRSVIMGDEMDS